MWFTASSNQTQYRITLFFGPEPLADRPSHTSCTFNVKKRSWKGGIQIAVEASGEQVERARRLLSLPNVLAEVLTDVPIDEQAVYRLRADDLLAQTVCACKLELALAGGLSQENKRIPALQFEEELPHLMTDHRTPILSHIMRELDLPDLSSLSGPR